MSKKQEKLPSQYSEGRRARVNGHTRFACPYPASTKMDLRSWWLAGWHDLDMEMTA